MFPKFYLKTSVLVILILFLIIIHLFFGGRYFSVALLFVGALFLAHRKNAPFYQDFLRLGQETFLAPAQGKVIAVYETFFPELDNTYKTIAIQVPWWAEYGVYFPLGAEVKESKNFRFKIPENNMKLFPEVVGDETFGCLMTMLNREVGEFHLFVARSGFLRRPRLYVRAGDRGRMGANLGFLPFGGIVWLFLTPKGNEIFVRPGDLIDPLGTFIAGTKGKM